MADLSLGSNTRAFHVFYGQQPVLLIEDRPGYLHSMARLPEGMAAPKHPWLNGVSLTPLHEHRLRQILLVSANFDDLMQRLVGEGYDLSGKQNQPIWAMSGPKVRLAHSDGHVVAAIWDCEGPLIHLAAPSELDTANGHSMVTAYDPRVIPQLRTAIAHTQTLEELCATLASQGLHPCG